MALSKKARRRWILAVVALAAVAYFGYTYWNGKRYEVPKGIAWGNGRVEAKLTDVSAKEPLRVKDILVNEGDLVRPGQVLVHLDTSTLDAQLAEANASVAAARDRLAVARAAISRSKSQIELAKIEADRSHNLLEQNAGSQREYDVRKMTVETTSASLAEATAQLQTAQQEVDVALANAATVQSRINDATLTSPVLGRVLYRLAEPGEVLGPGGRALTLVNLEDVYMEIFLPAKEATAVKIGAEGRIATDVSNDHAAPGFVSFVSPEAQFTPKEVETKSEREKLMFRVKIQVPREFVASFIENIKTGIRGVGYVKIDPSASWPSWLKSLPTPASAAGAPRGTAPPDTASRAM